MATSKKPVKKKPVNSAGNASTKKKVPASAKKKAKKKRSRILLFILEIFVLLIMVVVLYSVLKIEKVGKVNLPAEEIVINPEVEQKEETVLKGYRNVACSVWTQLRGRSPKTPEAIPS